MNVYHELKKIAGLNQRIRYLSERLVDKIDTDELDFTSARLICGCSEKNGHLYQNGVRLDNGGLVDDDYYCRQHTGCCEDDYYGQLYFKTDVPGQFVEISFGYY